MLLQQITRGISVVTLLLLVPTPYSAQTSDVQAWVTAKAESAKRYELPENSGSVMVLEDNEPMSPRYGLKVVYAIVRKRGTSIDIVDARRLDDKRKVFEALVAPQTLMLLSGGFYCCSGWNPRDYVPLGYVVTDGQIRNGRANFRYGGVFWMDSDSGYHITSIADYSDSTIARTALQSTPILIRNGEVDVGGGDPNRFDRLAIGLAADTAFVVVGAFRPDGKAATMLEFATMTRELGVIHGLQTVLALDGGPSAHIYVPSAKLHLGSGFTSYVPNVVHVRRR